MNWTEGALARHSRRKGWDKDAARQKEYFAKARARKAEGTTSKDSRGASFVPDYIPRSQAPRIQPAGSSPIRPKSKAARKRLIHRRKEPHEGTSSISGQSTSSRLGKRSAEPRDDSGPSQRREPVDIDAKRRKLLEKTDWTGVNFQKPISVDFSWHKTQGRIPDARLHDTFVLHKNHLEDEQTKRRLRRRDKEGVLDGGSGGQIRLRIGSQDLRWSRASNSVRSPTSHHDPLSTLEWKSHKAQQEGVSTTCTASNLSSSPSYSSRLHAARHPTSIWNSPNNEPQRKRQRTFEDPKYVVRSSPLVIHHPQPTRSNRLSLFNIRSPDSEAAGSTIVQTGASKDAFERITKDDVQWDSWLNRHDESERQSRLETPAAHNYPRSITPGVSQYWAGSEGSRPSSGVRVTRGQSPIIVSSSSNSTTSSEDADQPLYHTEPDLSKASPLPAQVRNVETHPTRLCTPPARTPDEKQDRCFKPNSGLLLSTVTQLSEAPGDRNLMDLLIEEEESQPRVNLRLPMEREGTPEDEDEIWKKFVFDTDDDAEINRKARDEARQQAAQDLRLPEVDIASDTPEPPSTSHARLSTSPQPTLVTSTISPPSNVSDSITASLEPPSTEGTSTTAQVGSPKLQASDFKFHQPRLFIGRLATKPPVVAKSLVQPGPQPQRRGRGRPRKRRAEGRPDFRAMPGFDDDPIEES
ncbi:hypothetical protein G7046_g6109 [Stylonectria norvegica]|nr:hypothetical protein G7046_g6109 [Stylonectria norvegica]